MSTKKKQNTNPPSQVQASENITPQPAAAPASPPPITVADIKTMVAVINTSTQRGAFRANELSQVGQLHDKLVAFLQFLEGSTPTEGQPAQEGA